MTPEITKRPRNSSDGADDASATDDDTESPQQQQATNAQVDLLIAADVNSLDVTIKAQCGILLE